MESVRNFKKVWWDPAPLPVKAYAVVGCFVGTSFMMLIDVRNLVDVIKATIACGDRTAMVKAYVLPVAVIGALVRASSRFVVGASIWPIATTCLLSSLEDSFVKESAKLAVTTVQTAVTQDGQ